MCGQFLTDGYGTVHHSFSVFFYIKKRIHFSVGVIDQYTSILHTVLIMFVWLVAGADLFAG
jgi:hypothetical protein